MVFFGVRVYGFAPNLADCARWGTASPTSAPPIVRHGLRPPSLEEIVRDADKGLILTALQARSEQTVRRLAGVIDVLPPSVVENTAMWVHQHVHGRVYTRPWARYDGTADVKIVDVHVKPGIRDVLRAMRTCITTARPQRDDPIVVAFVVAVYDVISSRLEPELVVTAEDGEVTDDDIGPAPAPRPVPSNLSSSSSSSSAAAAAATAAAATTA